MRKSLQPVVGYHVATVRGRVKVTRLTAVLKHNFIVQMLPLVASKINMLATLFLLFLVSPGLSTEKGECSLSLKCHSD